MKAAVYTEYGSPDVLQFKEVAKPTPKEGEVLVKVYATALSAADWHYLRGEPMMFRFAAGFPKPKITVLGADMAGRVEAVGQNVSVFQPGDEVFGDLSLCGLGAFAEYVSVPEGVLAMKPTGMSFEAAAAAPLAGVTALQGLRDAGQIKPGQKVLINGASGGVGTFAVQIAKAFGAEVTAVCSTRNMDTARSIGADHVIDYTQEDFTRNGQRYDLIAAANGYHSLFDYKRALAHGGTYVMIGGTMPQMFQAMLLASVMSRTGGKKMTSVKSNPNGKDLAALGELFKNGKVVPVIDRCYPLSEIAEAFRYFEAGRVQGKVVITVAQPSES